MYKFSELLSTSKIKNNPTTIIKLQQVKNNIGLKIELNTRDDQFWKIFAPVN